MTQTQKKYSQTKAILGITKASLISLVRDPSTVVFSILFPIIFIMIFGFLGGGGGKVNVAVKSGTNKEDRVYKALEKNESVKLITDETDEENQKKLEKGSIDAIINVQTVSAEISSVDVTTSSASPVDGGLFLGILQGMSDRASIQAANIQNPPIQIKNTQISGRQYKTIDFILPGQLGFALLNIGVFGTAFVFLRLRETLVLKRFFATPISKTSILLGEGIARLIFATVQATIIIAIGALFLDFTLVHGLLTLGGMLLLSLLGLIIFLGFGFIVSGLSKNENSVPAIANIFTLPQFLLAGTFFPVEAFPSWLQPISKALPLTYLNNAMRKVAFEGAGLNQIWHELLILIVWGVGIYIVAIKIFKWK